MSKRTVRGESPTGGSGLVVSTALGGRFKRAASVVVVVVGAVVAGGAVVVVVLPAPGVVVAGVSSWLDATATAVPAAAAPAPAMPRVAPRPHAPPAAEPAGMGRDTARARDAEDGARTQRAAGGESGGHGREHGHGGVVEEGGDRDVLLALLRAADDDGRVLRGPAGVEPLVLTLDVVVDVLAHQLLAG